LLLPNFPTVLNLLKPKKLRKLKDRKMKKLLNSLRNSSRVTKTSLLLLSGKTNTLKRLKPLPKWKPMSKSKMDFKLRLETLTLDMRPSTTLLSVTGSILLNVVSKEENFLEDKSRESQSPEPLSENHYRDCS
jgi:hypothetical protein